MTLQLCKSCATNMQTLQTEGAHMAMKYQTFPLELKAEPVDNGTIEGYASVFEVVDNGMDVVQRGAFAKSLGGRKVKMLWQHDMSKPIGVWDEIREDERGLYVKGRILKDVQQGREAMALYKAGAMDSVSIGYRTIEAVEEAGGRVRRLTEIDLFEISAVTMPMLDQAIVSVKSIRTIREFEKGLRDAGFSQKEAKAIAADGFKGLADHRDDVEVGVDTKGATALMDAMKNLLETLNV